MTSTTPQGTLDARYSGADASPTTWADAERALTVAELYWVTTVRSDGRPHVTPLIAIWHDGALVFTTGPDEQKSRNLAANPHCALTTGTNTWNEGLDMVVQGDATRLVDDGTLRGIADAFVAKYGADWRFDVRDGALWGGGDHGPAWAFAVAPELIYAFGKGSFSQTRWRFPASPASMPSPASKLSR